MNRPFAIWLLLLLIAFNSLGGFFGGVQLVWDPSGKMLGFPEGTIEKTPFPSFLIPGLFLVLVYGFGGLGIVYGLLRRRSWARLAALALGIILMIWIAVQISLLGPPIAGIQVVYFLIGAAILGLSSMTPVKRYCTA